MTPIDVLRFVSARTAITQPSIHQRGSGWMWSTGPLSPAIRLQHRLGTEIENHGSSVCVCVGGGVTVPWVCVMWPNTEVSRALQKQQLVYACAVLYSLVSQAVQTERQAKRAEETEMRPSQQRPIPIFITRFVPVCQARPTTNTYGAQLRNSASVTSC